MKVVIIEDETPAANRLAKMLQSADSRLEVEARLDSVEAGVKYFNENQHPDLVFMDIQLADGLSFDIFSQTTVNAPVIFTTAFDQYTLRAFKVNSIDYLLKPVDETELKNALDKYRQFHGKETTGMPDKIMQVLKELQAGQYKERLIIRRGSQLSYLKTASTACCFADGKLCYAVDFDNHKYLLENNLSQLEEQLSPRQFFRINRALMVNIDAIKKVHTWPGNRLQIEFPWAAPADAVVSRERVVGFREWLGK